MQKYLSNRFVFEYFKLAASRDMNVDGTTPKNFDYTAPTSTGVQVFSLKGKIVDGAMDEDKFGGLAALTNGVQIRVYNAAGTLQKDLLAGNAIKSNADFAELTGGSIINSVGSGDDALFINLEFVQPLWLFEGDYIRVTISDDLSALTDFHLMVHGYSVPDSRP